MRYSELTYTSPVQVPHRLINGGLYTGEAAMGPWGNVPVPPDPSALAENLRSADPKTRHPDSHKMAMTNERPGNNHVSLQPYYTSYNLQTNPDLKCLK